MGYKSVVSDEKEMIFHIDANNLYGCAMSESLPYHEIKFDENIILEDILNNPDSRDIGYFVEVDLKHPDNVEEKKNFFSN